MNSNHFQSTSPTQPQPVPAAQKAAQADNQTIDKSTMDHLLAGQPPGTVIKCVTAQVIQTQQGPRIVLQGLQGADFTPQQLAAVQQQVKQQLLKGKTLLCLSNRVYRVVTHLKLKKGSYLN